ncbi:hypothetical protein [Arthrobacter humicola]
MEDGAPRSFQRVVTGRPARQASIVAYLVENGVTASCLGLLLTKEQFEADFTEFEETYFE